MMKKNDSLLTNISHQTLRLGLIAVVILSTLAACGGSAPKLTQATITSPAANAEVMVGDNIPIVGQASGENIVRVDVVIDSNIHATLSAEDMSAGVQDFPVQVNWTPALAGAHFVQLDVYGPENKLLGKSDAVIFSAKAQPVAPTAAPEPTATPAPAAPTVAPTASTVLTTTDAVTGTTATTTTTTATGTATLTATLTITNDFANVRAGPGTDYQLVGQMQQNVTAPIRGKNAAGDWWQITFADGPNGLGWVFGELVRVDNAANVAVVTAPPLPTSAPTAAGPTTTPPSVTGATPDPGATPAVVTTDAAAPAATASVSGCTESSPDWRGANPNYPFCAKQDLTWGDPQGEWNVYDNGKDIPLSISWNLYGDTIDQVWMHFDPSDTACEFARPAQNVVNTQVPAAGTYNFNVSQFAYGGTYRVYLSILLKDGRVVNWGEKKLCIR